MSPPCPFCERIATGKTALRTELAAAFPDAYPVSIGHTLVIPVRHVPSLFELSASELAEIWDLLTVAKSKLEREHRIDGWNVGTNVSAAGGQTVDHAHVHLIPRYRGDVLDATGGIRGVIPSRRLYSVDTQRHE